MRASRVRIRNVVLPAGALVLAGVAACNPSLVPASGGSMSVTPDAASSPPPPDASFAFNVPEGGRGHAPEVASQSCVQESHEAELLPADVLLLVDASSTMTFPVESTGGGPAPTGWELVHDALSSFIADPKSRGLSVALDFFPAVMSCAADADCAAFLPGAKLPGGVCQRQLCAVTPPLSCSASIYERPAVDFTPLPAGAAALKTGLDGRSAVRGAGTPMLQAVKGALAHLAADLQQNPGRSAALVVASTGIAEDDCAQDAQAMTRAVTAAKAGTPAVSTYTIGLLAPDDFVNTQVLDRMAAAGGTAKAIVLGRATDLRDSFLAALQKIRGTALPCEFAIPAPSTGELDYGKVNVQFTGATGSQAIGYASDPGHCSSTRGGWYYDRDPAQGGQPSRVVACPATCQLFMTDPAARVQLEFGCKTVVIE
jgi:hypothetical protein